MPLSDASVDFVAGWVSGAASVFALQPVDTVLTRWQAGLVQLPQQQAAAAAARAGGSGATASLMSVSWARSLTQTFGVTSLWRGATPMISALPLQNAILMGGYGVGQQYYADYGHDDAITATTTQSSSNNNNQRRLGAIFVGGCTGGILQSFLMSPVEMIKVLNQCHPTAAATGKKVVTNIFHASSWRGLGATLLRDGIPHGVWFLSYDVCKDALGQEHLLGSSSVAVPLLSGAVAASVAWGVGYPADLIKTRQQAGGTLGIVGTAQELIQQANGRVIQGLYRGFGLKLVRAVPASMIGFSVYELVKKQLV